MNKTTPQKRKAKPKKKPVKRTSRVSPDININTVIEPKKAEATDGESKKVNNEGSIKNETFGRVGGRQTTKVKDFFISHPDEELTPKDIAFFCNIPHNTAKTACWRLYNKGFITQPLKNHYAYKQLVTATELQTIQKTHLLKIHNLMLTIPSGSGFTSGVRGARVPNAVTQSTLTTNEKQEPAAREKAAVSPAKRIYKDDPKARIKKSDKFSVGAASVKIYHYTYKTVVYVECSDPALDLAELNRVIGVIEGRGYNLESAEIRRIEVNIDVPDLHIDGANCIELRTFSKAWQRMYNKGNRLREEVILRGARIPLEEGIAALRGKQVLATNALYLETEALKKQVNELQENLKENNRAVSVLANIAWRIVDADKKGGAAT